MTDKTLIIAGSSRAGGNTTKIVELFSDGMPDRTNLNIIDLYKCNIGFFDYDYNNQDDDFVMVSQKMLEATKIIFVTPIYWYAMSAPMKALFDRFSDLLELRKPAGKAMKGKKTYLMAHGATDDELPKGFEVPFERTAEYFDMEYGGKCFLKMDSDGNISENVSDNLTAFRKKVCS